MDLIADINELIACSMLERQKLVGLYAAIPATQCRRRTTCCMMLPEMAFIEALAAFSRLKKMTASKRVQILQKLVKYFFLNPVEISACPFLESPECLIYSDRFFGCRAYGLWSPAVYAKLSTQAQTAKQHLQKQWANLNVTLPKAVTGFQAPYCPDVEILDGGEINDQQLDEIEKNIDTLSREFSREDKAYRHTYFSDLSFLITTWIFGYQKAVGLKFTLVKDIVSTGNRAKMDKMLSSVADPLAKIF